MIPTESTRTKLLYVSATQFSGTTLLSFLLNQHHDIATVGHTTGWSFQNPDEFLCSCGSRIADCPLFRHVAEAYERTGLQFKANDFGTTFRVVDNSALNYYLTESLPTISVTWLERFRDSLVKLWPSARRELSRQMLANRVFVDSVLDYWDASCYLDNSHSPFRLRRLVEECAFDVHNLHLLRDPRGVTLSLMTNSGLSAEEGINVWLRRQQDIIRVSRTVPKTMRVCYERLCLSPDIVLHEIQKFVGLKEQAFTGNFKDAGHHILGNRMRLKDGSIRLDERWKRDLSSVHIRVIEEGLKRFLKRKQGSQLSTIIDYYLSESYLASSAQERNLLT